MTITTITSKFRLGSVNAFLLREGDRALLVDTGIANDREGFLAALGRAGVDPGQLSLIVLTHADGDHSGNCAFLRREWGAKVAIHGAEVAALAGEPGYLNRNPPKHPRAAALVLKLATCLVAIDPPEPCAADIMLEDGQDLRPYGIDARVVLVPGHSKGSVAVLAADGSLFAGDLLWNIKRPKLHLTLDDPAAARRSVGRLAALGAKRVYPGHGGPFDFADCLGTALGREGTTKEA